MKLPNAIYPGRIVSIITVASNKGNVTEDFNVTAYANTTIIGSQTVYSLAPGENTTIIFDWDTTGLAPRSNFTLWAEASQVPGETSIDDNRFADGYVYIKHQGDINGDGKINIYDIVLGVAAYGSQTGDSNWNEDVDLAPPYGIINLYDIVTIIANCGE